MPRGVRVPKAINTNMEKVQFPCVSGTKKTPLKDQVHKYY